MQRGGHLGAALGAVAPIVYLAAAAGFEALAVLAALAAVPLGPLPDIDRRLPGLHHRGPTHTLWFVGLVAAVSGYLGWAVGPTPACGARLGAFGAAVAATATGSHVAVDALTPMGVRPFAPVSTWHWRVGLVRASNPVANLVFLLVGSGLSVGAFVLGQGAGP